MVIQSAFDSGVAGFQAATERASESAANIASQQTDNIQARSSSTNVETEQAVQETKPLTEELVSLKVAEREAQVAAKVITTADEVVGSLIDTRA
ncbi:hypothetical protein [Psychrobium sp. 1_MG-2023]|uniref:hypothetical protein n=1 Tax=Psychrobium sp. 1_MG-2023 TaxID=3062624 RepID=UPI000C325E75|nr:hypothetical protein [Psychrobium sp. 1_MG-2023]MDP2561957.1 hypothetical protein [Psychrobium sp. 1_MG-2023]PKF58661.1 hypothetical protein CW748_03230 [Alteromonadales bacterium alter-6D02]